VAYILYSVIFNTALFIILKLFSTFKIDTLQAIVVNYLTAFLVGAYFCKDTFSITSNTNQQWFTGSLLLGFLFISVFYVTALTSQRNGLSVASVASKMSVIIPISFGVLLFNESLGLLKVLGILLALLAVYLTSKKEKGAVKNYKNLAFPFLLFIGAGTIDTSLKILQSKYLKDEEIALFSTNTFLLAFIIGSLLLTYIAFKKGIKMNGRNILGGIALGVPNFFSLYFIIKMLDNTALESSTIFTIHNVSIVVLSTLVGILLFKEKMLLRNKIGIALALVSIILVTL
jgi:drug/metabolite transporter (DMT)-like permease